MQESLENYQDQEHSEGNNRARQEVLQRAQKILEEKTELAKQLDHLKDKQRAFKSKLAASEDKNERLRLQAEADKERQEK